MGLVVVITLVLLTILDNSIQQDFIISPSNFAQRFTPDATSWSDRAIPRYFQGLTQQHPSKFIRMDQALIDNNEDELAEDDIDVQLPKMDDYNYARKGSQSQPQRLSPVVRLGSNYNQAVSHKQSARISLMSPQQSPLPYFDPEAEEEMNGRSQSLAGVEDKNQQRFLMSLFPFGFLQTPVLTVYSFVATRITSTSTKYCIKSLNYGGVTACGGRKRRAAEQLDALRFDPVMVEPSPINPMQFSTPPPEKESFAELAGSPSNVVISSMPETEETVWPAKNNYRAGRLRAFYISTTTIRIPTVSIRYTTTMKTIQLLADANSAQLTCLPIGLTLCHAN